MIKKQLTCKTYLTAYGENTVVARLDTDDPNNVNAIVTEPAERLDHHPMIRLSEDRHYLVGEIADRLYEYEQLGFTPEELKEIVAQLKVFKAREDFRDYLIVGGRCNGKTAWLQRAMYEHLAGRYQDGLTAKVTLIDEVHTVKPDPWMLAKSFNVPSNLRIEKVIFNDPATIVIWKDGTKTVVKATNEVFDPEKGLAMAISKKALGNKGNYFNHISKWVDEYRKEHPAAKTAVLYYDNKPVMLVDTKSHPIKCNQTCARCKWGINNPGCQQHEYCTGCPHEIDGKTSCKCSLINDGEPCKYFEELLAQPKNKKEK